MYLETKLAAKTIHCVEILFVPRDKELAEIKEDLKSMRQKWELSIHPAWMNERFERAMQKAENRIVEAQRQKNFSHVYNPYAESQYKAQQQETRRLQQLLEEVIHTFDDNPKIIYFKEHLQKRLA